MFEIGTWEDTGVRCRSVAQCVVVVSSGRVMMMMIIITSTSSVVAATNTHRTTTTTTSMIDGAVSLTIIVQDSPSLDCNILLSR
jgi:hypothetical protein